MRDYEPVRVLHVLRDHLKKRIFRRTGRGGV